MNVEMTSNPTFKTGMSGLPIYRVQFLNTETGEPVSDVDIETAADCVRYINDNPMIKDALGFKKGESVDTDLEKLVNAVLYPYYPPEVVYIESLSSLSGLDQYVKDTVTVYKKKGTIVDKFNLSVMVLAGSKTLVRCSLVRIQDNFRETIENRILNLSPGKETVLDFNIPSFNKDTQYFFEISDNENNVSSAKINYKFLLPIYVGYVKDGLLDPTLSNSYLNMYLNGIITQTDRVEKRLVEENSVQSGFYDIVPDKTPLCPFIMVPLKWNNLYKIEDINGMDITKFFKHNNNITIQTSTENTDYEGYKIYIAKQPADAKTKTRYLKKITYTFTHDANWKTSATEGEQTEVLTGFDVLTNGPVDSRFVKESYDDLAYISKPYEGLVVYIKNIKTYYKYNEYGAWEVTNNMTRFYSGKPSNTMGGKLDISIDLDTGNVYQKNNANVWELKGNMRGVSK